MGARARRRYKKLAYRSDGGMGLKDEHPTSNVERRAGES